MKIYICIYVQGMGLFKAESDQNDKMFQIPEVVNAIVAKRLALLSR